METKTYIHTNENVTVTMHAVKFCSQQPMPGYESFWIEFKIRAESGGTCDITIFRGTAKEVFGLLKNIEHEAHKAIEDGLVE